MTSNFENIVQMVSLKSFSVKGMGSHFSTFFNCFLGWFKEGAGQMTIFGNCGLK